MVKQTLPKAERAQLKAEYMTHKVKQTYIEVRWLSQASDTIKNKNTFILGKFQDKGVLHSLA